MILRYIAVAVVVVCWLAVWFAQEGMPTIGMSIVAVFESSCAGYFLWQAGVFERDQEAAERARLERQDGRAHIKVQEVPR